MSNFTDITRTTKKLICEPSLHNNQFIFDIEMRFSFKKKYLFQAMSYVPIIANNIFFKQFKI